MTTQAQSIVHLPRVEIQFCVQCKWNLRAAYYAQELLQTFSNTIGEIALVPVTGGIFTITLSQFDAEATAPTTTTTSKDNQSQPNETEPEPKPSSAAVKTIQVWDRKTDGGFPETKELKNRIRNLIDPSKDMGHIDRSLKKSQPTPQTAASVSSQEQPKIQADSRVSESVDSGVAVSTSDTNATPKPQEPAQEPKHSHGAGIEEGQKESVVPIENCEECRLAAVEDLEQQLAKVNSV